MLEFCGVFGNEFTRNTLIFGVDNSSLSHADSLRNNIMLGKGNTLGTNGGFDALEKMFNITFCKAKTKFYTSLHYNGDNSHFFVVASFKGNVHDLSVDYNAIDKSDILNIHRYLMVKKNIK